MWDKARTVAHMTDTETKRPNRIKVDVRIAPAGLQKVDDMAHARHTTRSEMIRVLVAYAIDRMPADWGRTL